MMLALHPQWRSITAGANALHLLRQARERGLADECAGCLLDACFDLMVAGHRARTGMALPLTSLSRFSWRINDFVFTYESILNDSAIESWIAAVAGGAWLVVVVPEDREKACRAAVSTLPHASHVTVESLRSFIDLRCLWAGLDMRCGRQDLIRTLMHAYNRHTTQARTDTGLFADAP